MNRRNVIAVAFLLPAQAVLPHPASAATAERVLLGWYKFVLELVRHTATYSPPVASRSFAYLGITSYEAIASGNRRLTSLAGQVNGLSAMPSRISGAAYEDVIVLNAALAEAVGNFFGNTGPSGKRALDAVTKRLKKEAESGVDPAVAARSAAYGKAIADHILEWSRSDGGATIENMGFPLQYALEKGPAHWVPTNKINLQQTPLLPAWGKNRTFALPHGGACPLPPPPAYSEDKDSAFYKQALEVYSVSKQLTDEQRTIARFWSDDPMLSPTPPGHWVSIALQIFERDSLPVDRQSEILARLGIAIADAFIGCWEAKFRYDLLRPVTYIKRLIDKSWEAMLITPPFPEYPSGHSTQSGAAAVVLRQAFGDPFEFEDATHVKDGIKPRKFESFDAAAKEAAMSRLYGGIHFRAANEQGLVQGACIGSYAAALRMGS